VVRPSLEKQEFPALFSRHAPFVWRVLRRHGVRESDVEDACQEVFVVVLRRLEDFDGSAGVRTWLYAIARRVAARFRGRAHTRREVSMGPPAEATVPAQAEQRAEQSELARAIAGALANLSEDKREVFELYEIDGMPMAEVAATLEVPLQTAFTRLYAARAELRAHLQRARVVEAVRGHSQARSQGGSR
jgi:RNA polymerase sigma-70 factor, ECF subfamily